MGDEACAWFGGPSATAIFFSPPEFNGVTVLCQDYKDIGVLL